MSTAGMDSDDTELAKIKHKYRSVTGNVFSVKVMKGTGTLGISLSGHKDRTQMCVFICGLNPAGVAHKHGGISVGDEVVEVNGNVLFGRCHLNASAVFKNVAGSEVVLVLRRTDQGLDNMAVKPVTQFPIELEDETCEERYSKIKGVANIQVKKGTGGLGIMIIEGKNKDYGNGVFISDLQQGSAAEIAGIAIGDMILAVNKENMMGAAFDKVQGLLKTTEGILDMWVASPARAKAQAAGDGKAGAAPAVKKDVSEKPTIAPKPTMLPPPPNNHVMPPQPIITTPITAQPITTSQSSTLNASNSDNFVDSKNNDKTDSNDDDSSTNDQSSSNIIPGEISPTPDVVVLNSQCDDSNIKSTNNDSDNSNDANPPKISQSSENNSSTSKPSPIYSTSSSNQPLDLTSSVEIPNNSTTTKPPEQPVDLTTKPLDLTTTIPVAPLVVTTKSSTTEILAPPAPISVQYNVAKITTLPVNSSPLPVNASATAGPAVPATDPITPGEETQIEISKEKLGLGLSIVGGSDTLLKGAILIHEVYPDGAAAKDGRLKPGDQILEVSGNNFRAISHQKALSVLRQTPAKVMMKVYREKESPTADDLLDTFSVTLTKKSGKGLGLSIVGRKNGPGVFISDLVEGGVAEGDGRLMQGDQILEVNKTDVRASSQEQAAAVLKCAGASVEMKLGRLKIHKKD